MVTPSCRDPEFLHTCSVSPCWSTQKAQIMVTPVLRGPELLHTCSVSPCWPVNEGCAFFFRREFGIPYGSNTPPKKKRPNIWWEKRRKNAVRYRVDRGTLYNTCTEFQDISPKKNLRLFYLGRSSWNLLVYERVIRDGYDLPPCIQQHGRSTSKHQWSKGRLTWHTVHSNQRKPRKIRTLWYQVHTTIYKRQE